VHHEKKRSTAQGGVIIEGVDNLLVRLSHCCSPIPGDEIVGYITKGRGVSVHRVGCPNIIAAEEHGERIIKVKWENPDGDKTNYNADLEVQGYNRNGLLNDVLKSINNSTKFLNSVNGKVDHDKMVTINASIGIRNRDHLQHIMDNLKNIPDVYVVKRTIH
jgi:GTP pyrophosphokinase